MQKLPRRWLQFFFVALIIISATLCVILWQIHNEFFLKTYNQTARRIVLEPHSNAQKLITTLKDAKIIQSPRALALLFKLYQISPQLKAGTYQFLPEDTIWSLIEKMIKGKVLMQRLTIVEGMRLCELVQSFRQSPDFRFQVESIASLKGTHDSLEGLLFASTYQYPVGEDIFPILRLAKQELQVRLNEVWQGRDSNLPYQAPYELLTVASIIEKETGNAFERGLISGVIVNRLRLHMPLQMDPIVAYGIKGCRHVILKGSDIKQDSPYNSYLHRGLPPTPIAMVSMESLLAAAHPTQSVYLYFVAKGDGFHYFSSNYQEQIVAIKQYLRNQHAN